MQQVINLTNFSSSKRPNPLAGQLGPQLTLLEELPVGNGELTSLSSLLSLPVKLC